MLSIIPNEGNENILNVDLGGGGDRHIFLYISIYLYIYRFIYQSNYCYDTKSYRKKYFDFKIIRLRICV